MGGESLSKPARSKDHGSRLGGREQLENDVPKKIGVKLDVSGHRGLTKHVYSTAHQPLTSARSPSASIPRPQHGNGLVEGQCLWTLKARMTSGFLS